MSELETVQNSSRPNTKASLVADLKRLGVKEGDIVLCHASMSKLGWVIGREVTVVEALIEAVGNEGTLIMPSQSGDNSDPTYWENPPVPNEWIETIKKKMPPYDPTRTPTRSMGKVVEALLKYPGAIRSNHPQVSFCGYGMYAHEILDCHQLSPGLGDGSPLKKLYDLNAKILLLGVEYGNCTALHLVETHQKNISWSHNGSSMLVNGKATWVDFDEIDYDDEDFEALGADYEETNHVATDLVGIAHCRYIDLHCLIDYADRWFGINRK